MTRLASSEKSAPDLSSAVPRPVLVDSHVHFHGCFASDRFLDAAHENFLLSARSLGLADRPLGFLLLTEIGGTPFFQALQQGTSTTRGSRWSFAATAEPDSLVGSRDGEPLLIIVSGRQLATREGLEVLALCCSQALEDGDGILSTLEAVRAVKGLPTIPWGFGKWSMGRGRILTELLEREEPGEIYLGDTSVRWRHAPEPKEFRRARERGIRILPGTDPFPYPEDIAKAGSYGLVLRAHLDIARPAASLRWALRRPDTVSEPYGQREGFLGFATKQIGMQFRKRMEGRR